MRVMDLDEENHDDLKDLRRWHLLTNDAHPLYQPHGFKTPEYPERHMEKCKSEVERQQVYNQYLP